MDDAHVDESFIRKFDPGHGRLAMMMRSTLTIEDLLDDDVCDPLIEETIDLGEDRG